MRYLVFLLYLVTGLAYAGSSSVYVTQSTQDFDTAYKNVSTALEANNFFVVFEPDIGANLAGFADKWKDYNLNRLSRIKSMVFCNGWYANQVSNADPDMLALCPLHLTMTHKDGITRVLFVRPDSIAKGSKAEAVAKDLTADVIKAIEQGMN